MTRVGHPNSRPGVIVDPNARGLFDPSSRTIVGRPKPLWGERLLWALPFDQSGRQRYLPSHPAGEAANFGMDFSFVVPPGVGIASGSLAIQTNVALPVDASADWTIGPIEIRGRAIYARLTGGVPGTDYQLIWTATDTAGYVWPRLGLVLVANTS